ncbi:MAG TPA: LysM peptidoglycan-binding domain-containing protein [Capillibacterium sp.]
MSISSRELKAGLFPEGSLESPCPSFELTGEPRWTIVKYVAKNGDTINLLSRRFQIPAPLILKLNALPPDTPIEQGQVILLPESCP